MPVGAMARSIALAARPRTAWLSPSPTITIVLGFAAIIVAGAWLLSLPAASATGEPTSFLTALFTATSATCVAGLSVVDIADHYSAFGELVIMGLIQLGGLGYMTAWAILAVILGWRIGLREQVILTETHQIYDLGGVVRFARRIVTTVLAIEAVGAAILFGWWARQMPLSTAAYMGIFHSISAFNNAGFTLMGRFRSLTAYVGDPVVTLTIATLVTVGGLGFPVLLDLRHRRLTLHSKVVLLATGVLIAVGTVLILVFESRSPQALSHLPVPTRVLAAFFQAASPRTGGFHTIDIGALTESTLMLMIALMFIGASPGGTGGGIKTTTFLVPFAVILGTLRGTGEPVLFRRRLPLFVVYKAVTVALLSVAFVVSMTVLLTFVEGTMFMPALFEITSAFGSVGLTTGLTPQLSPWGQVIVMVTAFSGRLGLLMIAFGLSRRQRQPLIRYPEERLYI
jgi:trk system potassium uptake protein TrkH